MVTPSRRRGTAQGASAKADRRGVVEVTVEAPAAGDLKVVAAARSARQRKRRNLAVAKAHADAAGR